MIPLAKATLLTPTTQVGGNFTTLQGVLLVVGVETEISTKNGMMYMDSDNIKVEFDESDFKDMDDGLLENIAKKLKVEAKDVKAKVLPKKSVASKVKSTLTKPKVVEEKKVEEPSEEESSDE